MDELIRILEPVPVLLGLIITIIRFPTVWRGWTTRKWLRTTGVLLGAKIGMEQREEGDWSDGAFQPSGHFTYRYYAWVRYEYTVNDLIYQSEKIGYGIGFSDSNEMGIRAWLLQRRWEAGKQVPVYFNPSKPSQSVLITGVAWGHLLQLLGGIAITLVGVAILNWS